MAWLNQPKSEQLIYQLCEMMTSVGAGAYVLQFVLQFANVGAVLHWLFARGCCFTVSERM